MSQWDQLANKETIKKTIASLKGNGIESFVVDSGAEAKEKVLSIIPVNAEVMTMTSITLQTIGVTTEIQDSDRYDSVRKKLAAKGKKVPDMEMKRWGAAHDWVAGSVHAVTEDGKILIASNTGSQLASYVYGANHVIWVVGAQKIVKNFDEGIKRIYEYCLPLENERAKKAYGAPGSAVSKILIVNKEIVPGRITLIFVREKLGF